jgi:hypothetical protein
MWRKALSEMEVLLRLMRLSFWRSNNNLGEKGCHWRRRKKRRERPESAATDESSIPEFTARKSSSKSFRAEHKLKLVMDEKKKKPKRRQTFESSDITADSSKVQFEDAQESQFYEAISRKKKKRNEAGHLLARSLPITVSSIRTAFSCNDRKLGRSATKEHEGENEGL